MTCWNPITSWGSESFLRERKKKKHSQPSISSFSDLEEHEGKDLMKGDINSSHLLPGPTLSDPCTLLGKMISFVRCLRFNIFYHGRSHARLLISFVIYALSLPWLPQRNPCLCDLALELSLHQLNLNVSSLIPRVSLKFLLLHFFCFFFVFLFLARIPPV